MRNMNRVTAGVIVGTSLLLTTSALAGGFAIREQSTTGLGMAFAGSAAGSDLTSMYWNPAAVTTQDGLNSASSYTLIVPDTDITAKPGSRLPYTIGQAVDVGEIGAVGASYYNYQLNKDFYVGLGLNSPFGLVTKPENPLWSGQVQSETTKMLTLNATPTIGYKVAPWVSVAAGLQVEYMEVTMKSALVPNRALSVLKGDDTAVGFTAGVLLTPMTGTNIGVGFRSSIDHQLEGTAATPASVKEVSANIETPEMVTVSLRQQVTPGFALLGSYEWTNWSRLETLKVYDRISGTLVKSDNYNWEDGWMASVGAEFQATNDITLRSGIGYESSPVPDAFRGSAIPDSNRTWLSVGGTYKWSESTLFDIGYSHVAFENATIDKTGTAVVPAGRRLVTIPVRLNADVENSADIVSAGLRVKW
jgi:long-chain fatty acid transport protein